MNRPLEVQVVILCGGAGSRLWPLTAERSKPLVDITPQENLLDGTIRRATLLSSRDPVLVTTVNHPLPSSYDRYPQICEPYLNDTGVAMARVALHFLDQDPVIIVMMPADHYIGNESQYIDDITTALNQYEDGITLIGILPTSPSTVYGYIMERDRHVVFQEKPSRDRATDLINRGGYWNSGMVIVNSKTLYDALPPSLVQAATIPGPGKYPSFDVAVLQNYPRLKLFRSNEWGWSDVGSWSQLLQVVDSPHSYHHRHSDEVKCYNSMGMEIMIVGVSEPLIVVTHCNRLLILHPEYESSYKDLVTRLTDSTTL